MPYRPDRSVRDREILRLADEGRSYTDLAAMYELTTPRIGQIVRAERKKQGVEPRRPPGARP